MSRACAIGLALTFLFSGVSGRVSAADDPHLLGWWTMDDGAGEVAADAGAKGIDGTLINGPAWGKDGPRDGCLLLDGLDDYVLVKDAFNLPEYSIALWFRADATGQRDLLSAQPDTVAHGILLEVGADGRLRYLHRFPFGGSGGSNIYAAGNFSDGVWHHVTAVKLATEIRLYIDGRQVGTQPDSSAFDSPLTNIYLGILDSRMQRMLAGALDDVRIYDRVLSEAEIVELAFRPKAHSPSPADGAIGVNQPLLQWKAGTNAVFHDVYVGTSPDLDANDLAASRLPFTMHWYAPGLTPGATCYWRVDEVAADGTVYTGSVWSFVVQDLKAYLPNPADGAVDVSTAPTLTWRPGQTVARHHVYFGNDPDAVAQGAAGTDKGETAETSFAAGTLEAVTTYYWRVDETTFGGEVRTGAVWSFTTILPVDDFESYTDDEGSRIYESWTDGWTNSTGSQVGYSQAPFTERTIVHGGSQSMPLDYNNVNAPFYSEAEREFSSVQDWTVAGVDTLTLFVRGVAANGAGKLYVAVEDSTGKVAVVPSEAPLTKTIWTPVSIPLSQLSGVNLSRVKVLCLGVGDRDAPTGGGAGRLYIDDIQLTRPAPTQ